MVYTSNDEVYVIPCLYLTVSHTDYNSFHIISAAAWQEPKLPKCCQQYFTR